MGLENLLNIARSQGYTPKDSPVAKVEIERNKQQLEKLRGVYGNTKATFEQWKKIPFNLTDETKDYWWSVYDELNPNDTREELRRDLLDGLNSRQTLAEKDFFLRESLSTMPGYIVDEFKPVFEQVEAGLTRQHLFKSEATYQRDLQDRLAKFAGMGLDPDVPTKQHIDDFMRLERMNLLDVASLQNGRLGVLDNEKNFRPSFAVSDRADVFRDVDPYGNVPVEEEVIVNSLAYPVVQEFINLESSVSRKKTLDSTNASNTQIVSLLRQGRVSRDRWDSAINTVDNLPLDQKLQALVEGEVNARRVSSDKEIANLVFELTKTYGDRFDATENQ